jgi:hypothetical protein
VNGRKLFVICGLLRNSTKIAMQFLGLEQCSQKAPANAKKLKQRPDFFGNPSRRRPTIEQCSAKLLKQRLM